MKKILVAQFKHETFSASPLISDEKAFRERDYLFYEDIYPRFHGARNELGAFFDVFEKEEGYELIPVIAFNAQPGGIVSSHVFKKAQNELIQTILSMDRVDGILLALHGAMVCQCCFDGEGELLSSLREAVGNDIPIIASLDLHANITDLMIEKATAFFPYDYYPHSDTYEAGYRAAECMRDSLSGLIDPVVVHHKLSIDLPLMPTEEPCLKKHLIKAQSYRNKGSFINVNIVHGFYLSDIKEQGMDVVVVSNGNKEQAQLLADELADELWKDADSFHRDFADLDAALEEIIRSDKMPFVIADCADNPGGGASGDTTGLLRALLESDIKNVAFASIYDPQCVQTAKRAGVGNMVHVSIGGKVAPGTGAGIECDAYVKLISDGKHYTKDYCKGTLTNLGTTAVLVVNGIEILVCSHRVQAWDLEAFRSNGITPEDKKILCVKSSVHYRTSYSKVACKIFDVDLPSIMPLDPKKITYHNK